tara:strand:+ start:737 stop:913 length:177 start_codon:yes stop_codon:yes gene_type:complete
MEQDGTAWDESHSSRLMKQKNFEMSGEDIIPVLLVMVIGGCLDVAEHKYRWNGVRSNT